MLSGKSILEANTQGAVGNHGQRSAKEHGVVTFQWQQSKGHWCEIKVLTTKFSSNLLGGQRIMESCPSLAAGFQKTA